MDHNSRPNFTLDKAKLLGIPTARFDFGTVKVATGASLAVNHCSFVVKQVFKYCWESGMTLTGNKLSVRHYPNENSRSKFTRSQRLTCRIH